ncbi:MAG: DUF1540 domain-containing protein [Clostridia bacterium]|nr:DUF1540 domain-containing protein [Clostridia bacterium]NCC42911.1 DUF1540 domain-containing protein [Clostridia bacterium]
MPILKCTAVKCVYNQEKLCSKGDIEVRGDHAKSVDDTCCSSFRERSGDRNEYEQSCGCGCKTIDVGCSAHKCTFNEDEECSADAIHINGSNACDCDETCCGTFREK